MVRGKENCFMKKILILLVFVMIFQGCVFTSDYFQAKTDNAFYLSVIDPAGNEIKTGASINDPKQIEMIKEMYV